MAMAATVPGVLTASDNSRRDAQHLSRCRQRTSARGVEQHFQVSYIFNFHLKLNLVSDGLSNSLSGSRVWLSFIES